jgi:ribosomal protein S18 acetylase RimI-like enzyme
MLPTLGWFGCGTATPYEVEVNDLVARAHAGQFPSLDVRVAEDPSDGSLIGLCGTSPRALPNDPDAAYVALIGINGPFRGKHDHNGSKLGDVLLDDALRAIREGWGGGPMPPTWAMVAPNNRASHNLFERHGFKKISGAAGGYDIRYLEREMP